MALDADAGLRALLPFAVLLRYPVVCARAPNRKNHESFGSELGLPGVIACVNAGRGAWYNGPVFSHLPDYHVRAMPGTEGPFTVQGGRFRVVFEQHLGEG